MAVVPSSGTHSSVPAGTAGGALAGTYPNPTLAPSVSASGLTGSVAASRYVGATSSGSPASGAHLLGDFIIDQTGAIFICTTAGTPGTWTQAGATYNGGTITNPETIDVGSLATAGGLEITGTSGANVDRLKVAFLHTLFELTGDGSLQVESDDAMGMGLTGTADSGAALVLSNSPTAYSVPITASATRAASEVFAPNVGQIAGMSTLYGLLTALNSAPADNTLLAGQCAIWFDSTNGVGATKLMLKGKSADGTVKTAAIVLA